MKEKSETDGEEWRTLTAQGREEAIQFVEILRQSEAPFLLGHKVKELIEGGHYSGREVGFFQYLAEQLQR